ncbi:hypothetical protein Bca101_083013 [Brassica carinata]
MSKQKDINESSIWFIRSVLALSVMIMMMSNTAMSNTGNVWIRNSLQNQKDLMVHCKSAHKDMGYHRTIIYGVMYGKDMASNITKCLMFSVATIGKLEKMESIISLRWCTVGMLFYQKLHPWDRVMQDIRGVDDGKEGGDLRKR